MKERENESGKMMKIKKMTFEHSFMFINNFSSPFFFPKNDEKVS